MKSLAILSLAALAAASPVDLTARDAQVAALEASLLQARQLQSTRNELEDGDAGACPQAIFVFARGSTESGNMGLSVGPRVADALEDDFGADQVWVQGVGGPYAAALAPNALPKGTDQDSIDEAQRLFALANSKCPNSALLVGGYSQGAALMAAALTEAPANVKDQAKGAVLFGYTKNQQNDGQIPDFPQDKTQVFCNRGDAVCTGSLIITAAHLAYNGDASGPAPQFLASKVQ